MTDLIDESGEWDGVALDTHFVAADARLIRKLPLSKRHPDDVQY